MTITRIAGLSIAAPALLLAALSSASALSTSYAREHPAACAEAWAKKDDSRSICGSRDFCATHRNDDRISRIVCDPYESKADRKLDSIILSGAWLDAARNLKDMEPWSQCVASDVRDLHPCAMVADLLDATGDRLLPAGMKNAKLALRAHIQVYTFPVTVVRLGIGAGRVGVMEVTWNRNANGPRETHSVRLNPSEIDRLLAAINRSDFWRLPYQGQHIGPTDGEWAAVELSVAGWRGHVQDIIGDADAADLSILVNELTRMIKRRWTDVPA
ncbi:MAG TPA: hypothetical protein VJP60_01910 [Rhizomicrobium sp.]|nr:hypothetical protein [Rhizomicrobium sp.]